MEETNIVPKIVIEGKEYDYPEGITPLGDGLFCVDWNLIEIAKELEESEKTFRFFNPRHLGNYELEKDGDATEIFYGQGFSKDEMKELMTNIINKGLDYPLLCYFILEGEKVKVRVHDGERRYRCLDRMINKDMKVWSRQQKQFVSAKEVYGKVTCRVDNMTEEEAFTQACAVSETSVKWGDGANARLVKTLYEQGKKDEEICKLLNKSKQWLAETASLNELDDFCFNFLLANKINRKVALDLAKIKDVDNRQQWLRDAWKDAVETSKVIAAKNDKLLEKAEAAEELAEAILEEAKVNGESVETVAELTQAVAAAVAKTEKRKTNNAASARPVVKSKNLRRAAGGLFNNALRGPKIKKNLQVVSEMIDKNDVTVTDIKTLTIIKAILQSILDGEEDIMSGLKKIL